MRTCPSLQLLFLKVPGVFLQSKRLMLRNRNVANKVFVGKDLAAESVRLLRREGWLWVDVVILRMVVI